MGMVIIFALLTMAPILTAQENSEAVFHNEAARQQAVDPEASAWEVLDKSLSSGSFEKRQALSALSTLGEPNEHAVKLAEAALHDKDSQVRQWAALTLGELKAHDAIPELRQALNDNNEVAFAAAKALISLGDKSGEQMLIAVISGDRKDTPGILTNAVRDAKARLRHPEGLFLMGAEDATGAMFGPASMGITALKDTADLKGKGTPGRAAAAAYLAKDPDPYAIPLLEWALGDDNQFVRLEAARALGARGGKESIPKLEFTLSDPHNAVRDMAAASILRIMARNGAEGTPDDTPSCGGPAPPKK
jgi:HEAT repeat protein